MTATHHSFPRRVLIAVSIAAGVGVALLAAWYTTSVLLLALAGLLLGVFLHGLSRFVAGRLHVARELALTLVCVSIVGMGALLGVLAGPKLVRQLDGLGRQLPTSIENLQQAARETSVGEFILSNVPEADLLSSAGAVFGRVAGAFSTLLGAIAGGIVILVIGLYLAADPYVYRGSVVRLVPPRHRARVEEIFSIIAHALRRWLLGRMTSMFIVGILTTIGLAILGVPLALVLGIIAALLDFVPNLGPVIAAIPAILVALTEDPLLAAYVALLYAGVQTVEAYFLTPLIEQYAVQIPPALLITVQLLSGVLFGILGLLMATPLVVIGVVLIQTLYVEDTLGENVRELGQQDP